MTVLVCRKLRIFPFRHTKEYDAENMMQKDTKVPSNAATCNFTRGTSRVFRLFMNPAGIEIYTHIETVDRKRPEVLRKNTCIQWH